jgi:hypothetical protein
VDSISSRVEIRKVGDTSLKPFNCTDPQYGRRFATVRVGTAVFGYKELNTALRGRKWSHFHGRMKEIEKLIRLRHGGFVPKTDDALIYAEVISSLAYVEFDEAEFLCYVPAWCGKWLPWAAKSEIEEVMYERTKIRFSPLTADALGHALLVSYDERCQLDLRTIGAHDVSKRQRTKLQKAKRRERDRLAKQKKRRAAGAQTRDTYLAEANSTTKPWLAFGCCRRTWERRGKPMPSHAAQNSISAEIFEAESPDLPSVAGLSPHNPVRVGGVDRLATVISPVGCPSSPKRLLQQSVSMVDGVAIPQSRPDRVSAVHG